jgi:flagellar hook-associated protein 2
MQVASFSGLASGIQWRDMIDQMMAIESRPIERIEEQRTAIEARATAWSTFRSRVQALETAAAALSGSSKLLSTRALVSSMGAAPFTAQTTSAAQPGSHAVSVLGYRAPNYGTSLLS